MTDTTPTPPVSDTGLRQRIETALRSLNPDGGTLVDLDDDNDVTVVATAVLPMLVAERNTARAAELRAWAARLDTRPDWTVADIAALMRGRADALTAPGATRQDGGQP